MPVQQTRSDDTMISIGLRTQDKCQTDRTDKQTSKQTMCPVLTCLSLIASFKRSVRVWWLCDDWDLRISNDSTSMLQGHNNIWYQQKCFEECIWLNTANDTSYGYGWLTNWPSQNLGAQSRFYCSGWETSGMEFQALWAWCRPHEPYQFPNGRERCDKEIGAACAWRKHWG